MATINYGIFDIGATRTFSTNGTSTAAFSRGQKFQAYDSAIKSLNTFVYVFSKKTIRKGNPVGWSAYGHIQTVKSAGASGKPAGVTCSLISASTYGFIQTRGANSYRVRTDTGIAAGDLCIKDNDGNDEHLETMARSAASTQTGWVMGLAMAADSGSYMAPGKLILRTWD